jgi:hypothetical protein
MDSEMPNLQEKTYESQDLELLDKIKDIVGDEEISRRVLDEVLSWVGQQMKWGGKYDGYREGSAGEDA